MYSSMMATLNQVERLGGIIIGTGAGYSRVQGCIEYMKRHIYGTRRPPIQATMIQTEGREVGKQCKKEGDLLHRL